MAAIGFIYAWQKLYPVLIFRSVNCTHLKEISPPQYHICIDNTFRACGKDSPDKKTTGKTHLHRNYSQSDLNIYA